MLKIIELLGLRLARAVSELSIGFAQVGDRHRYLTGILSNNRGARQELVPSHGRFVLLNQGGLTSTTIADK